MSSSTFAYCNHIEPSTFDLRTVCYDTFMCRHVDSEMVLFNLRSVEMGKSVSH